MSISLGWSKQDAPRQARYTLLYLQIKTLPVKRDMYPNKGKRNETKRPETPKGSRNPTSAAAVATRGEEATPQAQRYQKRQQRLRRQVYGVPQGGRRRASGRVQPQTAACGVPQLVRQAGREGGGGGSSAVGQRRDGKGLENASTAGKKVHVATGSKTAAMHVGRVRRVVTNTNTNQDSAEEQAEAGEGEGSNTTVHTMRCAFAQITDRRTCPPIVTNGFSICCYYPTEAAKRKADLSYSSVTCRAMSVSRLNVIRKYDY